MVPRYDFSAADSAKVEKKTTPALDVDKKYNRQYGACTCTCTMYDVGSYSRVLSKSEGVPGQYFAILHARAGAKLQAVGEEYEHFRLPAELIDGETNTGSIELLQTPNGATARAPHRTYLSLNSHTSRPSQRRR